MMAEVPKISDAVTHYSSHRLHANVHFSAIETIIQSIKTYQSIIYIITEHKQNILQMRYCKIQVHYYGKKGMILLEIMEIRWII